MKKFERADIGEFMMAAQASKDSGFKRVEIDPDDVIRLCDQILTLEDELLDVGRLLMKAMAAQ